MLKNYIKIAFRNLIRDKAYSVLNLIGLSMGLASVIMIMAYVRYELSYDKSYSNHTQVYRLTREAKSANTDEVFIDVPSGLAQALQKEFPAVNTFSGVFASNVEVKHHNDIVSINSIQAGADFFKIFNFPFAKGDPGSSLTEPGSIVISERIAQKLFAGKEAVGSNITTVGGKVLHITGVMKNLPANSHLTGDIVVSGSGDKSMAESLNWMAYTSFPQYILLNNHTDARQLENQFASIYKKYQFPKDVSIHLQPVTDIHLRSHAQNEISINSDIKYVYIFMSAALLILFVACINYINLTTARSLQRAKEIGLRKVLGALRKQLIMQFLTESFLFFFISTVLALFISYTMWPAFSAVITGYEYVMPLFDTKSALMVFAVFVTGGLLAGAYPAFFLSSLQPVKVLRGLSKFGINISLRKALVVLQFTISGVLMVSTIVVYQQLNFISNARLGFNKDNLITVPFYMSNSHVAAFKYELTKNRDIQSATVASWSIGKDYGGSSSMEDKKDPKRQLQFSFINADFDFVKTMQINVKAGRNFSAAFGTDTVNAENLNKKNLPYEQFKKELATQSVILNEEAVKLLDIKKPVGHVISTGAVQGTIIGVAENFNGLTLHQKIPAVVMTCSAISEYGQMFIRISPRNTQNTLNYIADQWKKFYPSHRFDFAFADDKLQKLYSADKRLGTLFGTFATLAIAIGCLGLFGLISLTVQNRLKEIGIRKVLGASVIDITSLISADFVKLVIVSFVISSPVAWYLMTNWLQSFAYRIDIHWWIFLIACGIAIVISLVTLSFQSIKAAIANPVKSLRSE
ncbi:putative ABC transport system permease protein [Mucilaginibacter pineti]|uniref:Putative ABC transport system permease protein n=1 Tax=Mucilaginibacter pineti TaxID=1391627 RepID=A0A1G6SZB8_9SPHI|nr:ABC transporter permease [Mucilaginibacter pineti]SDD21596.1 putative ABC transport system permease protein [Mucilaginibacter pineti]